MPSLGVRGEYFVVSSSWALVSPGTERMLVNFGKANLAGMACPRQQSNKVQIVLEKIGDHWRLFAGERLERRCVDRSELHLEKG